MSRVSETSGNSEGGNNVKKKEDISTRKSRRSSGIIYMEFPEEANIAPLIDAKTTIALPSPVVNNKNKTSDESVDVPVKRGRGRPKLTEEQRKTRSKSTPKTKRKKRVRSDSEDYDSDPATSVTVKNKKSKKNSSVPVGRKSSSEIPTKLKGPGSFLAAEDQTIAELSKLLKRQAPFRGEESKKILPVSSKPSPLPKQKSKTNTERKSDVSVQSRRSVSGLYPDSDDQTSLPEAISFTDKFFIRRRGCFLIRNYFRVRAHLKALGGTSFSVKKWKRGKLPLKILSRARVESVVGMLRKTITAHFRVSVQPNGMDDTEQRFVLERRLFLRRNYTKVRKNSSIATMDFNAKAVSITVKEKPNSIIDEYFKVGSVGFHPKGRQNDPDNPLVLVLQK